MKKNWYLSLWGVLLTIFCCAQAFTPSYDLTVVSQIKYACSLTRLGIGLIDSLKDDLAINHINTSNYYNFTDVSAPVRKIVENPDKRPGNVAILFDFLWIKSATPADAVPPSHIKIAYSTCESTSIPSQWVSILNNKFDAVVVTDDFCAHTYKDCGVTIPLFVLPHGIYVEELLKEPLRNGPSELFTFGLSAGLWPRKNQELLVEAFAAEFGNNPKVQLKLHSRAGEKDYIKKVKSKIKKMGIRNIHTLLRVFSASEYNEFLKSLDCIVLLSKGEGFSITPREGLALGIPTIISDNTAHHTLSETGFFYSVPSLIREPVSNHLFNGYMGYDFNCSLADARKALREIYVNYHVYLEKAKRGRTWVQRYLWKNLRNKFLSLIKPKKVLLGEENTIADDFLMTTSPSLYKKYSEMINAR